MESSIIASEACQSDEIQLAEEEITAIISTLPTENGWLSSIDYPVYNFQGFWYQVFYIRGAIALSKLPDVFKPSPSDIILCSTPKSGTTWLKALSFAIATRTRFAEDNPLLTTIPHELIPSLEIDVAQKHQPRDPNLPLFATHLPYTSLPSSIFTSGCKIVYICRDPKDAFTSCLHFSHKMRANKDVTEPIPLEEAFDLFCRGISPFGPYWDHVLGYWKAFLDHPHKILFLKYCDMMNDAEFHVKRLVEFMQFPFSEKEEREGVIARIVEMCSFENLSKVNNSGIYRKNGSVSIPRDAFFRKGTIGDWKNHLTEEMANKIDQITLDKLGKYGLTL